MIKKIFVLGIDGVPYSLIDKFFKENKLSNLKSLCEKGTYKKMNSVYPTISSVAWTTYMTGTNPAQHGIFGFIDRDANPFAVKIPLANDRKADSLWKKLSSMNKKVIVLNVPLTYPPEKVNGILASGFLCTDINKLCYPEKYNKFFKSKGYIIDVDAWLARENKRKFMDELFKALDKRFKIAFDLMKDEEWDFFQLHIMETDRLLHFAWNDIEGKGEFTKEAFQFFKKLDSYIGELKERLGKDDAFIILSDHGFCRIKKVVQLNSWLEQEGLLKFPAQEEKKLQDYDADSICYSLIPGRIFINLEGREEKGTVPRKKYKKVRKMLMKKLLSFQYPETGEKIIDKVFIREDIYAGPFLEEAADLIAHPVNGFDLKARVNTEIFEDDVLNGMHTYDDAFIFSNCINIKSVKSIEDVSKCIQNFY